MPTKPKSESGSPPQPAPKERRRHLRFSFTASVQVVEPKSGAQIQGRITDLGRGGCYVDTISPFPVGTVLRVCIRREKVSFEAMAKVIFSQVGMGMGLAFISASPDQVRLFQSWILELSRNVLPLPDPTVPDQRVSGAMVEKDRRASRRFKAKPGAYAFHIEWSGAIRDLSMDGIFILDADPLPVGTNIAFSLLLGTKPSRFEGLSGGPWLRKAWGFNSLECPSMPEGTCYRRSPTIKSPKFCSQTGSIPRDVQ